MNTPNVRTLIRRETVQFTVACLGRRIAEDYRDRDLVLVGILKGALFFLADLARAIPLPMQIGFLGVSSYGAATETSGVVRITCDLDIDIEGRDILVVEDIVDSGLSLEFLLRHLAGRRPRSLKVCALLDKPSRRRVQVPVHYTGFTIEDLFVVGYGLDLDQKYRNLPYIGYLEETANASRETSPSPMAEGYAAGLPLPLPREREGEGG